MYGDFLSKAQLLGGQSGLSLLVCACRTHPVHDMGRLFKQVDKYGLKAYKHVLKLYLVGLYFKVLAWLIPYCPKVFSKKVSHFTTRKLQNTDRFILLLLGKTQLVLCRPFQYNHVFIARDWMTAVKLIEMEKTIGRWCQVKSKAVTPYDHSLWRIVFIERMIHIKNDLKQLKKGLIENLFFHSFYYEWFVILVISSLMFQRREVTSVEVWNQIIFKTVIADFALRLGGLLLRYLRIHLTLMCVGWWRKYLEYAQELLFENTRMDNFISKASKANKIRSKQRTWVKRLMWLEGEMRQIRPRYSVFRLYILTSGLYLLMRIKLMV